MLTNIPEIQLFVRRTYNRSIFVRRAHVHPDLPLQQHAFVHRAYVNSTSSFQAFLRRTHVDCNCPLGFPPQPTRQSTLSIISHSVS
jgi:hypothetical protein